MAPLTTKPKSPPLQGLALLLAVLALHLLLLWLLQGALRSPAPLRDEARAPVVLIRPLPPVAAPREVPALQPPSPPAPTALPARQAPATSAQPAPGPRLAPGPAPAEPDAAPGWAAAPVPASAAASAPPGRLLDTPASREAIRAAAGRLSTREQGALATDEAAPLSEQERLGQEIARGARGDCLKGEYAGAGMGLLSLPFWLLAELRDKCRR